MLECASMMHILLSIMASLGSSTYQNGAVGVSLELPTGATVVATSSSPPSCAISGGNSSNSWHLRLERGVNPGAITARELLEATQKAGEEAGNRVVLENTPLKAGSIDGWWLLEKKVEGAQSTIIGKFVLPTSGEQFILVSVMMDAAVWSKNSAELKQTIRSIVPLDPVDLVAQKIKGLDTATARLTSLNEQSLQPLIGFREWRRIQATSETTGSLHDIGYAFIQIDPGNMEEVVIRDGQESLEDTGIIVTIRTRLVPNPATGIVTDSFARYWMSWDGKEERWSNRVNRWLEEASVVESETGMRNRPAIGSPKSKVMVIQQDLTSDVIVPPFKALAQDPWLPRALVWVLGPLLAHSNHDTKYIWMTYDNAGEGQRVITRTDQTISKRDSHWTIETHFGESDVTLWTTFDSAGHLLVQEQKNGATVTGTTDDELRAIWQPRNLW
jgi:hypothetical protein